MNIRQNLRALIAEGLHLTLGHMLALFLTGLLGAAYLWLRSLEEHLLAVGALVSAAAVLLAFVTLIGRRIWRQGPITPRLGGGEERGHAMQRDDRDMRKLGLVHLHVDGDVNDVLQLIEEFNSESNRPHGQPKFKYNGASCKILNHYWAHRWCCRCSAVWWASKYR